MFRLLLKVVWKNVVFLGNHVVGTFWETYVKIWHVIPPSGHSAPLRGQSHSSSAIFERVTHIRSVKTQEQGKAGQQDTV